MQRVTNLLQKLKHLHEQLLNVSHEKTECIKSGELEELTALLIKERKLVRSIEKLEKERQELVNELFLDWNIKTENKTVTEMLLYIDDEQLRVNLEDAVVTLTEVIVQLKQNEQLNSNLIQQSMQFVHLSLDMLQPSLQNMNYSDKQSDKDSSERSAFDTKA